jgi:glycosyltransferase involved in cell wall biosynthesis
MHKGYDLYIKSAMNILDRRNNVTFVAVGTGDTFANCVNLVPVKYTENIRFLGQQRDVESIVNAFDIGVLVSKNEGISNAIMEYMALEKPVVASMNSGNEELVQNNTTGLLARHGDIADLTEKIEYLLGNKDVAAAMGKAGRERVERMFNIEKMTLEHMNLYERVLNG